jgi:hypothetical protein
MLAAVVSRKASSHGSDRSRPKRHQPFHCAFGIHFDLAAAPDRMNSRCDCDGFQADFIDIPRMSIQEKLIHELRAVVLVTLFFAMWLGALMILKLFILEDYHIRLGGFSMVLIGALVLAKVVLILEHVPLGAWLRHQPVLVDVILRTIIFAFGTFVVILLEKAFESRHERGGFGPALMNVFQHRDMPHVWANTICVTGALLFYNLLAALNRHLGSGGLVKVFLSPGKHD